jgi:dCTP deaminase
MSKPITPVFPGKDDLLKRLRVDTPEDHRLHVTPLIDAAIQIGEGTIDLRCGTEFILIRKTRRSVVDPLGDSIRGRKIGEYQEKTYVEPGRFLYLHPGQFILGCSLEYVRLPRDLSAYVVGRSSWGREGLIIATATFVNPTYVGVITLELVNEGEAPIALYPGTRIAQLVFNNVSPVSPDTRLLKSKYNVTTGPSFSKLYLDPEWKLVGELGARLDSSTIKPICPECQKITQIDKATYYDFRGEVPCSNCHAVLHLETDSGHLKSVRTIRKST